MTKFTAALVLALTATLAQAGWESDTNHDTKIRELRQQQFDTQMQQQRQQTQDFNTYNSNRHQPTQQPNLELWRPRCTYNCD